MTQDKAARFRALHQGPDIFVVANAWDAGTARLLQGLGFAALATTSAGLATALGRPDGCGLVSREEALANARQIVEATDLPVTADLEGGYGTAPEECARTIALAARAGLAGGSIEDATGVADHPIHDFALAVERVAASAEEAQRHGFVLTARSENFLHDRPDLDDTIKRLQAFEAAGADVLFAPGLPDIAAISTVCAALSRPVNVLMGLWPPLYPLSELEDAGVRRVSVGSAFARAATRGFLQAAREVRDKGTFGFAENSVTSAQIDALMSGQQP